MNFPKYLPRDLSHAGVKPNVIMLLHDDRVRIMFSTFCQHHMFLRIEMDATLLSTNVYTSLQFDV